MDNKLFIKRLSESTQRSPKEVETLIDGIVSIFKDKCKNMESIAIPGFGTFEPRKRLERINVHPSTGKKILIPPKITLSFKMSGVLKQKLKNIDIAD